MIAIIIAIAIINDNSELMRAARGLPGRSRAAAASRGQMGSRHPVKISAGLQIHIHISISMHIYIYIYTHTNM